jgi:hypothetical protein
LASRGGDEVGALDGAVFGADEDAGAAFGGRVCLALGVAALGADQLAGPRLEQGEFDAVALLVDAGAAEVLEDRLDVLFGFLAIPAGELRRLGIRLLAVAVVRLVIENDDVLQGHQIGMTRRNVSPSVSSVVISGS